MQKNYNKDIMSWDKFPDYDMLWCDPPWEQKMVKFFETQMNKLTGKPKPDNSIEGILNKLAELSDVRKPLIIEYSIKGSELVIQCMESKGHRLTKKQVATQTNGKPFLIMIFNSDITLNTDLKGWGYMSEYLSNFKNKIIFDPFAGIGASAKCVNKTGNIYIGSELSEARFKRLIKNNS